MVYWVTGRKGSGKTTMAKRLALQTGGIILDGDDIRQIFPQDYSADGRLNNQYNLAMLARLLEKQGFIVIISCVSPVQGVRIVLQRLFKECIEIEMPFGELWEGTDYEESPMREIEIGEIKDFIEIKDNCFKENNYGKRKLEDISTITAGTEPLPKAPAGGASEITFAYTGFRCPPDDNCPDGVGNTADTVPEGQEHVAGMVSEPVSQEENI